ncbi:hypothetical protein LINPERHAP1_LOCUS17229 [Linum perenne]
MIGSLVEENRRKNHRRCIRVHPIGKDAELVPRFLKRIGPTNFSVSTIWPGSYESPLIPFSHPIQVTEPIVKSPDSVYRFLKTINSLDQASTLRFSRLFQGFAGIPWTSNGPPEFLRRAGAVDHETVK